MITTAAPTISNVSVGKLLGFSTIGEGVTTVVGAAVVGASVGAVVCEGVDVGATGDVSETAMLVTE